MHDPETFLTFRKYQDPALAEEIAGLLRDNRIEYEIETNDHFFNPSFINDAISQAMTDLKLHPEDFTKADKVLADYYKTQLKLVDKDYYLFSFSDQELDEIIAKPDEWGPLDYQLAQQILSDRGQDMTPERVEGLKQQRITDLKQPERAGRAWIYIGFTSAILGGAIGIIVGALLINFKKTLPNGERIYAYRESDRRQGKIIVGISVISIFCWWIFWGPEPALVGFLGPL
jgi:hypothetical protein